MVTGVVSVSTGRVEAVSWFEHRSCRSKVAQGSRREARAVGTVQMNRRGGGRVAPYHCGFCDGWHVGHPPGRRR